MEGLERDALKAHEHHQFNSPSPELHPSQTQCSASSNDVWHEGSLTGHHEGVIDQWQDTGIRTHMAGEPQSLGIKLTI